MDSLARVNRLLRSWKTGDRCIAVVDITYVGTTHPPKVSAQVWEGTIGTVESVDVEGCLLVRWDGFFDRDSHRHMQGRSMLTAPDCVDPWSEP